MYLKSIELIGFKSFADKTKLTFEPGMTAIVGPNGCGKSNISDAIRWVIGEQSAKALRGTNMADVIFTGTDHRKALAMAEVSLTLTDCESALGTEYHEVTVTRRVFRSGEGQYFLNKTPCRLKDIHRLFMDTGIGTTSYSVMEQGRIDRILSSRPEDRRAVFEEASGITKFKTDKQEAIRKLEHTDANLLRLADVIREVRRQIGSLQRQAGKARRYKSLRDELRVLDLLVTRNRLTHADTTIRDLEKEIADLDQTLATVHREVADMEVRSQQMRDTLMQTEREVGLVMEAGVEARNKLDRTRELITVNRQRIAEYREWTARDTREIDRTRQQHQEQQDALKALTAEIEQARADEQRAKDDLRECQERFEAHRRQIDAARVQVQKLREESVQLESVLTRRQNELVNIDARERASAIQRERLSAEKAQLARVTDDFEKHRQEMDGLLESLKTEVAQGLQSLKTLEERRDAGRQDLSTAQEQLADLQKSAAAREAQIDLLKERDHAAEGFAGGARLLLNDANPLNLDPSQLLGSLAGQIDVEPAYGAAAEAALRAWLDAVVIRDASYALTVLRKLQEKRQGSARLLAVPSPRPLDPSEGPGTRLLDHISAGDEMKAILASLIGHVRVVSTPDEIPQPLPPRAAFATKDGWLVQGDGCMEFWMPELNDPTPLTRRRMLTEAEREQSGLVEQIGQVRLRMDRLREDVAGIQVDIQKAQPVLDEKRRTLAQKEGEARVLAREAGQSRERLETVGFELDRLLSQTGPGESERQVVAQAIVEVRDQREKMAADIAEANRTLQELENRHSDIQMDVTERRITFAGLSQKLEHLASQQKALGVLMKELSAAIEGRSAGVVSYEANMARLSEEASKAESSIGPLDQTVRENADKLQDLQKNRERQAAELKDFEAALVSRRTLLEERREEKSSRDVRIAEARMRRQNMIDRVTGEYHITLQDVMTEVPLDGSVEVPPSLEETETYVEELRAKLEAMGPVNLVAIEEYKQLEERLTFLTEQEDDLVKGKQQLMEMIRKINRTTTELFRSTFDQVNTNFQEMFNTLFGGGTAKLVLVDEEDILDCGIEIIARPPGKRLQNISLLSGGERTMTAVALLFAIYMIKPSPFCLLDELDAALDDSNIGRFAKVLENFLKQSQFIIITHNQHTITTANTLYGVTMPEKGISKVVSLRFNAHPPQPAEPELFEPATA